MKVFEQEVVVPGWLKNGSPLEGLQKAVTEACGKKAAPIRVAMVGKNRLGHVCEMEALGDVSGAKSPLPSSVFDYRQRKTERTSAFNAVMLIPTGVDCAIGGHAGDATPAARLIASQCDNLVLHPNVVNASDVNEQSDNALYVEGSVICRMMMGMVGLQKVRQNRVLLVTEERPDAPHVVDNTINCAEGARPLSRPLAIVEDAGRQRRLGAGDFAQGFHLADVAQAVLTDHGDANGGGLFAARLGDGLLQTFQRRAVLEPAGDNHFLFENFHRQRASCGSRPI